jgi:hypothetical protein
LLAAERPKSVKLACALWPLYLFILLCSTVRTPGGAVVIPRHRSIAASIDIELIEHLPAIKSIFDHFQFGLSIIAIHESYIPRHAFRLSRNEAQVPMAGTPAECLDSDCARGVVNVFGSVCLVHVCAIAIGSRDAMVRIHRWHPISSLIVCLFHMD